MHHLVVRHRQDEVFGEGIPDAEGELFVVILAEHRILLVVLQRVVHPAHVPLHAEAQAAHVGGARYHRPGGGFLGDGQGVRVIAIHRLVETAQERHGGEVFAAAMFVGDPLALLASVVEVKHRGDAVDAQTIDMVLVEPEQRAGHQEGAYFVAAIVEDGAFPFGMEALTRIGMLEQVGAVEIGETMLVAGKVRRHPVEYHADARLVQVVDQKHEVLRCALARGRGEIAGGLVTPGAEERMLCYRQQFDVGKAQFAHMIRQQRRDFPVAEGTIILLGHPSPRAQMHFVDRHRRIERVGCPSPRHPFAVIPGVSHIPDARTGEGRNFTEHGVGIGLVDLVVLVARGDVIFVAIAATDARHKAFPYAGAVLPRGQRLGRFVPAIEIADDRYGRGIWRPHREVHAIEPVAA